MQVANLKLISRLKVSLLLSTLYGIEFTRDLKLASLLSAKFRKGLRSFLGVPPRVSNDFLSVLTPHFSFDSFILRRKLGFLRRTVAPSDTLASVLFLEDRAVDYQVGLGFSADLFSFLKSYGLPELINCVEKPMITRALQDELCKESILCWERMRHAKSTSFLCSVFSNPSELYDAALAASSINLTTLRIFILMWTGSVSIHLFGAHERTCRFCSRDLASRHYFGCSFDTCQHLQLVVYARNRKFAELIHFMLSSYFLFSLRSKPLILSNEESFLLSLGDEPELPSSLF